MPQLVPALTTLRRQITTAHPDRSTTHDGWIGDQAHAARKSDHNPDQSGDVHAVDITHDPAHGVDGPALAEHLRTTKDPRIKYVISNGRIFAGPAGPHPWTWRTYPGTNPHKTHLHISCRAGPFARDSHVWSLPGPRSLSLPEDDRDLGPSVPAGTILLPGHHLTGARGDKLVLQGDGNLVLYDPAGRARWASGARGVRVAVQRDGNVVLYSAAGPAVWSTGTAAPWPPATVELALQPDGNLVLYSSGARWAITR